MELKEIRDKIDCIDREIANLFEKRMEWVAKVIEYKIENNMEILDSGREKEVIVKNLSNLKNRELKEYYEEMLKLMMKVSKDYQKQIMDKTISNRREL